MSDNTQTAVKTPLLTVKDNDLYPTEITRAGEDKKGCLYPALQRSQVEEAFKQVDEILKASGVDVKLFHLIPLDVISRKVYSMQKQMFQNIYGDTLANEEDWTTGNLEEFAKIVEEGRAATTGETKADLMEQHKEAVAAMTDSEFLMNSTKEQFMEAGQRVRELAEAIEAKSRTRAKKAPAADAVPAVPAVAA